MSKRKNDQKSGVGRERKSVMAGAICKVIGLPRRVAAWAKGTPFAPPHGEEGGEQKRDSEYGAPLRIPLDNLFRVVGTAVWRLEGRMLDLETKEPKEEFRRVWRHVEAIKDVLTEVGVDVIDWTGKRYDEGLPVKVVAEEKREGTKRAEIVETLLPTIRFRNAIHLQQGEVVVCRPPKEEVLDSGMPKTGGENSDSGAEEKDERAITQTLDRPKELCMKDVLLEIIRERPGVTLPHLMKRTGKGRKVVTEALAALKGEGRIERRSTRKKTGGYYVVEGEKGGSEGKTV